MKSLYTALLLSATLTGTSAAFADAAGNDSMRTQPVSDYVPLRFLQSAPPLYPSGLIAAGIREGEAIVAIQVDRTGGLVDCLAVAYSDPKFAERAVGAVRHWTFEPARLRGVAVGTTENIRFTYRVCGTAVVDLNMNVEAHAEVLKNRFDPSSNAFSACTRAELDRTPTPTFIVKPIYAPDSAQSPSPRHVTVEFYIDKEGRVRMPAVSREMNDANGNLAAAAVVAVSQWKFEPPRSRNMPTLIFARQDFNFLPSHSGSKPQTPRPLPEVVGQQQAQLLPPTVQS
jgi:hypothetical protein